ncbi:MBL fold metallo-hydrolase [Actinosynnema sp. NPDC023794]
MAGFSTHPDWNHLLWHARLGAAPRYGTARCAATVQDQLSDLGAKAEITAHLEPTGIAERVPLDLIAALPAGTARTPWDGPEVRIIEHRTHAPGHAALFIEEHGVLVAGDMLSDVLIPLLDWNDTADPIEDYLTALRLFDDMTDNVDVLVPGHGSVGGVDQLHARVHQDRAYVLALRGRARSQRPADRSIGQARLGVGGRCARGASSAACRENRTRLSTAALAADDRIFRST